MGKKYFCWNIDDGLEQDKKVVEILRRYGMGATFNLNSGLFGFRQMTQWDNDHPLRDVPLEVGRTAPGKFAEHFAIPADEVKDVYGGFEIAAHGLKHENFGELTAEEIARSVRTDKENLEKLFGQKIVGFAYPYGVYHDTAVEQLAAAGIRYARTTQVTDSFAMPQDPLRLPLTGQHQHPEIFRKLDAFFRSETEEDQFFLMFAHGFEFDFNTPESNWVKLEKICETVAAQPDIICCSTGEALCPAKKA